MPVFSLVWFSFIALNVFNAKSILYIKTVLFKTIQFSISTQLECQNQFYFKQISLA